MCKNKESLDLKKTRVITRVFFKSKSQKILIVNNLQAMIFK